MTDNYQIQDLSSNHTYRTELPNILFHLGLDPYELAVYCAIKRTAGDHGKCFKTTATLAADANIDRKKYIEVKNALACKTFDILGGKSIIHIQKRVDEKKGNMPDLITIIDIWPENYSYFLDQKKKTPCGQQPQPLVASSHNPCGQQPQKEEPSLKKNQYQEEPPPPQTPPIKNGGGAEEKKLNELNIETVKFIDPKGKETILNGSQIYRHFLSLSYPTSLIIEAIKIARNELNPVTSPFKYLEGVLNRLSQRTNTKKFTKEKFDKNDGVPPKCTAKGVNFYGEPAI